MSIDNRFKIAWSCRRGMLELDYILMPFFQNHFDTLTDRQKAHFVELLSCSDNDLFQWFMRREQPEKQSLIEIIQLIQDKQANSCA